MTLTLLKAIYNNYERDLNDISKDFINDYSLENIHYLSDVFTEFADSQTSIYYSDQFKIYTEHTEEAENLLIEYGYDLNEEIKSNTLYQICCKAGALYEYQVNINDLESDREKIVKCLLLNYLIENKIFLDIEKIKELFNEYADEDHIESLVDDIKEA